MESENESVGSVSHSVHEYDEMTPHQVKMQMAKEYIEELKNEMDDDELEDTLQKEIETVKFDKIADTIVLSEPVHYGRVCSHPLSIARTSKLTFVGCLNGDLYIYGDGYKSVIQFNDTIVVQSSPNDKYLVIGVDNVIYLYEILSVELEPNTKRKPIDHTLVLRLLKKLTGHRKKVTFMEFEKDSTILYSVANDRSLKVWSIRYSSALNNNDSGYIDTLFGHQDVISDMALLDKDKPITVGNRDKTARVFKIVNSSQMIYRVPQASDACNCITVINQNNFVVGTANGHLLLFTSQKKSPLYTLHDAHGMTMKSTICGEISYKHPISKLCSFPNSDLIVSSSNNQLILWKVDLENISFTPLNTVNMVYLYSFSQVK